MREDIVIRTENLGKTYGRGEKAVHAVRDLNLEVHRRQVYGFLGPNGAGKTTTIRMIMGLVRPTAGSAFVLGRDVRRSQEPLRRVGAMIEQPGFYNYLSGRENLAVLARTANGHDGQRIEVLLEQLDLSDEADRRVSSYSTGMRQRLGIASSLLADPELVILDEPTNGLDPAGIRKIRQFIRSLVEVEGKTVFLSSHLLHEVEQVCDRVAIIDKGQWVMEGKVADLLGAQAEELRLQASPLDEACAILEEDWTVVASSGWIVVTAAPDDAPEIVRRLVAKGIDVHQVVIKRKSLEEFFMDVTESKQ